MVGIHTTSSLLCRGEAVQLSPRGRTNLRGPQSAAVTEHNRIQPPKTAEHKERNQVRAAVRTHWGDTRKAAASKLELPTTTVSHTVIFKVAFSTFTLNLVPPSVVKPRNLI